jgi:hypothetical protein
VVLINARRCRPQSSYSSDVNNRKAVQESRPLPYWALGLALAGAAARLPLVPDMVSGLALGSERKGSGQGTVT